MTDRLNMGGVRKADSFDEQPQIKTGAFGGLNTVTPLLNLPFSDSPMLINTNSGITGSMSKRKGTKVTHYKPGTIEGFSAATVRTPLGHQYTITKQGLNAEIYETVGDVTNNVMTKTNVWDARAQKKRAVTAVTNEQYPRVFFCTGTNVPIQFVVLEAGVTTTTTSTSFTFDDPNSDFEFINPINVLLYKDGVRVTTAYTIGWASGVVTVSGLTSSPSGTNYDIVFITWQWVAEAFYNRGQDLYAWTSKFHIDRTDQNISIPEEVRTSLFTLGSSRVYPFWVYRTTDYGDSYTLDTGYDPSTVDEYHFGSGAIFLPGTPMQVAPNYVTFGTTRPYVSGVPAAPEEVHIIRGRALPFNGGVGASGSAVRVYVNGVLWSQNINPMVSANNSYYLRDANGDVITSTTTPASMITFDAAPTIGLAYTDEVWIINMTPSDVGSQAFQAYDKYRDWVAAPAFGLGLFSKYGDGFHPSCVCTYQGRVIFSGWAHDSLRIAASDVWDSKRIGRNFSNFDIPYNRGLAEEPLDLQLTSYADDYVVNLAELHSTLFVFTRNSVYQIKPTQGALSPTDVSVSKISNLGLVNARAMDTIENTIFFLSDSGVYDLTATQETGDYITGERTMKIRNLVNRQLSEANKDTTFLTYNKITNEVYLAYAARTDITTASRLYVYSTLRDSWFEYQTPSGFNLWAATPILDLVKGVGFLLWTSASSTSNLYALKTDDEDSYLDFVTTTTGTGSSQSITIPPTPSTTLTTTNAQHEYKPTFVVTPFPEVVDLVLTLNGLPLAHGTDWVKRANGTVYLFNNPGAGKTLVIRPRRPINDDEIGEINYGTADYYCPVVVVNNVVKEQDTDYTVNPITGTITLTAPAGSTVKVGLSYLTMFATPLFTQSVLGRFKRLFHFFGYFNNDVGLENFTGADVVGPQNPDEIVDRPRQQLGVNVAIAFDSGYSSELTYDLYSSGNLVWDFSFFDTASPVQDKPYILFKEPIQGINYGFQVYFYSWDEKFFDLVGWQVDGKVKGRYSVR
jgi:hypothetical protein